jgi:predicted transcriptional regulator of viral defense system
MKYRMTASPTRQILQLAHERGAIRPRDPTAEGIPHSYLLQLYRSGRLQKLGRGLYAAPDLDISENLSLAEACGRVPDGVICLLSALRFHQLLTQSPFQVWMAIHPKARKPGFDYPPLQIVRFSGAALTEGVEEHRVPEGPGRVYSIPKTVADCFKYRNKIGLDVAPEALRESRRDRRATMGELWHFAQVDRVSTVMRPYPEWVGAL